MIHTLRRDLIPLTRTINGATKQQKRRQIIDDLGSSGKKGLFCSHCYDFHEMKKKREQQKPILYLIAIGTENNMLLEKHHIAQRCTIFCMRCGENYCHLVCLFGYIFTFFYPMNHQKCVLHPPCSGRDANCQRHPRGPPSSIPRAV